MNHYQIKFLEDTLGHQMSSEELRHYNTYHSDTAGYFLIDERPVEKRKKLLLYSACWGRLIIHYLKTYRPDIYDQYHFSMLLDFALILHVLRDKHFDTPEIVERLFQNADAVIYSPIGAHYQQFSAEHLIRLVSPGCMTVSITGPHQGCWWPVS